MRTRATSANKYGYAHAVQMLVCTLSGPSPILLANARRGMAALGALFFHLPATPRIADGPAGRRGFIKRSNRGTFAFGRARHSGIPESAQKPRTTAPAAIMTLARGRPTSYEGYGLN